MVHVVRAAAAVILAVMIGLAAGCTNVTADQRGSSSPVGSVSAQITTGPATPTAASSSTVAPAFDCGDYIGTAAPASLAPLQVVLGVVALPTSPQNPALSTSLTGQTGPQRLFAKTGLPHRTHDQVRGGRLRQSRRHGVVGLPRGVLDRSPSLCTADRHGGRQAATGACRARNKLRRPAAASRTEPDLNRRLGNANPCRRSRSRNLTATRYPATPR